MRRSSANGQGQAADDRPGITFTRGDLAPWWAKVRKYEAECQVYHQRLGLEPFALDLRILATRGGSNRTHTQVHSRGGHPVHRFGEDAPGEGDF